MTQKKKSRVEREALYLLLELYNPDQRHRLACWEVFDAYAGDTEFRRASEAYVSLPLCGGRQSKALVKVYPDRLILLVGNGLLLATRFGDSRPVSVSSDWEAIVAAVGGFLSERQPA